MSTKNNIFEELKRAAKVAEEWIIEKRIKNTAEHIERTSINELMTLDNIASAKNPDWEEFDRQFKHIHEWQTYITDEVRFNWNKIPLIGRCAIISCCEEMASNENWD